VSVHNFGIWLTIAAIGRLYDTLYTVVIITAFVFHNHIVMKHFKKTEFHLTEKLRMAFR
jgi:hypothetical protein